MKRRYGVVLLVLSFVVCGNLSAEFSIIESVFVDGGGEIVGFDDPGLNALVGAYNQLHPSLVKAMAAPHFLAGFHLGVGSWLTFDGETFISLSANYQYFGSPAASASDGINTRMVTMDYNGFSMVFAWMLASQNLDFYLGPEGAVDLGQTALASVYNGGAPVALGSTDQYGFRAGLMAGLHLGMTPFWLQASVYYRYLGGYGFSDIKQKLAPSASAWYVDYANFESNASGVGLRIALIWGLLAKMTTIE